MDPERQAYWWWFDSHNTPKYSPWLRSTLAELDEKTKGMLKLIEEDADSFAQRAEMYYKKRPELISMVEDFYRAYRSLAERYDQHRMDPINRVKSPLRHSMPEFKAEFGLTSINSFGSFTEEAYGSSEESAESEVDDPEEDHDVVVVEDDDEIENQFMAATSCDELIKLREELEQLQQENEVHRNLIKQKEEAEKLKTEMESLMLENMNLMEQTKKKDEEKTEMGRKLGEVKSELTKMGEEIKQREKEAEKLKNEMESLMLENMNLMKQMKKKDEEKTEMGRKLEEVKSELNKMGEEMKAQNTYIQDILAGKDEEKREVIRQLSFGMEMLRQENQLLKKSIMKSAPKKHSSSEFRIFKRVGLGNLFGLSPKCPTSVVPL
ncbi:hypothetical protein Cgig2_012855 [Carnegiea gigantea]|uniref:NAB domain-containing protein n=1 Tax=Carnegiea gigantea TaxID=171969 RepID=A0A9Q1JIW9_9CARY|nr:hypothetical protein Cgig2_012855 [Carnegiea gigantea]